jgi:chromosome segregation ATPase
MEIIITAAVIALAIFAGLAKVAQAMREPRPIDPGALAELEEKIAEATARADALGALALQLQQKVIEAREGIEEMDGDRIRDEIESWMRNDFDITDHFDADDIRYDLEGKIDDLENKINDLEIMPQLLDELRYDEDARESLRDALARKAA